MELQEPETRITRLPFHSNPDILDEICEYLQDEQDGSSELLAHTSKRNLLWAGLTCKALLEPALDRLWSSLDSLFPLLKILPSFIQSDGTYVSSFFSLLHPIILSYCYKVLRGNVTPEDWARFDWYARRIRRFCYTRDPDHLDIAMHVYFRIAQLRSTPLLPSLRHLHCPSTSQNDFLISGICLFLSPSLQTLQFENISSVEDKLCGTVLHTLASDGAQIEKIILRGKGLSKDTLWMATRFEHLNLLELTGMGESLSPEIVEKIGSLPWITNLAIDFTDSRMEALSKDIGLKNLNSLTITAPVPFVEALISHIATTQLETFVAILPCNPTDDKKEFLAKVVDRWKDTLRRVALVHLPVEDFPNEHLRFDALAPLVPLRKLSYLKLEGYVMELTDDNISDMTIDWPEMDTLLLPFSNAIHRRPTIASLRNIARRCPKLRYLTIPLNILDLPAFTIPAGGPHTPAHELHTLTVASSDEVWDPRDLIQGARHIDYLFPKLKLLASYDGHDAERWMQMHDIIQMYQGVRREAVVFERMRVH